MSQDKIVLVQKLEGIADYVRRFLNQYKAYLLMKGYRLKREGDVVLKKGVIFTAKTDIGGWLIIEVPKTIVPKKTLIKVRCHSDANDVIFTASTINQKREIPPEILVELESFIEKTLQQIKS